MASLTFEELKLDAADATGSQPRIVSFKTDAPGDITATLTSAIPQATTHMCLRVGKTDLGCKDWADGTFTGTTTQQNADWELTLIGNGSETPTVDLALAFQAKAPSVKIEHARFDGTAFDDTNGIQASFATRAEGDARLVAEWGGHPFLYEIDLFDETAGSGDKTFANQGPATKVDQRFPLTVGEWRFILQNSEEGFGTTDLTATFSWP